MRYHRTNHPGLGFAARVSPPSSDIFLLSSNRTCSAASFPSEESSKWYDIRSDYVVMSYERTVIDRVPKQLLNSRVSRNVSVRSDYVVMSYERTVIDRVPKQLLNSRVSRNVSVRSLGFECSDRRCCVKVVEHHLLQVASGSDRERVCIGHKTNFDHPSKYPCSSVGRWTVSGGGRLFVEKVSRMITLA